MSYWQKRICFPATIALIMLIVLPMQQVRACTCSGSIVPETDAQLANMAQNRWGPTFLGLYDTEKIMAGPNEASHFSSPQQLCSRRALAYQKVCVLSCTKMSHKMSCLLRKVRYSGASLHNFDQSRQDMITASTY